MRKIQNLTHRMMLGLGSVAGMLGLSSITVYAKVSYVDANGNPVTPPPSTASTTSSSSTPFVTAWQDLMSQYHIIIAGIMGVGLLTSFVIFIIHFFQLATLGSAHPMIRRKIINNIMVSGIVTALLGGVSVIYAILYQTAFGKL